MTDQDTLKVKRYVDQPKWKPLNVDGKGFIENLSITSSYQTGKAPSLLTPVRELRPIKDDNVSAIDF